MNILKKNLKLKFFSLIAAIMLWYIVIASVNPTIENTYNNIPITYLNESSINERDLAIVGDKVETINLRLRGSTNRFMNLKTSDIKAEVNLAEYNENDRELPIQVTLPEGLNIVSKSINSVPIRIEKEISKTVQVKIPFENKPNNNLIVETNSIFPERISIAGPSSQVDLVTQVVGNVNINSINKNTTMNLEVYPADAKGNKVNGVTISQKFVNASFNVKMVKSIPIEIVTTGKLQDGLKKIDIKKTPPEVSVIGDLEKVEKLEKIKTKPIDLSLITDSGSYDIDFEIEDGISLSSSNNNYKVEIILDKVIDKTLNIKTNKIGMKNLKPSLTSKISSEINLVAVTIRGYESTIKKINSDNINLYVDLKDDGISSVSKEIKSEKIDGVDLISLSPNTIQVDITSKND